MKRSMINGKEFSYEKMATTAAIETFEEIVKGLAINFDLIQIVKSNFTEDFSGMLIVIAIKCLQGINGYNNFVNSIFYRSKAKVSIGNETKEIVIDRDFNYPEEVFDLVVDIIKQSFLFFSKVQEETTIDSAKIMDTVEKVIKVQR